MVRILRFTFASLLLCLMTGAAQAQLLGSSSVAPVAGIDGLKASVRAINLRNEQGDEIPLLNGPISFQLLPSTNAVVALKLGEVKAGTYLGFMAAFTEVAASYRGRAVPIRLQSGTVRQEFREPVKVGEDEIVIASLLVDLRKSLSKTNTGFLFIPAIRLEFERVGRRQSPVSFSGRIRKIDDTAKALAVIKDSPPSLTSSEESAVDVDASQATIVDACGNKLDFSALAVGQKADITGMSGQGIVLARLIRVERAAPPDDTKSAAALGTVLEINAEAKSFVMLVERLISDPELLRLAATDSPKERPFKLTVTWSERTIFFHDDERKTAADLAVGQHIGVRFPDFAPPFLAAIVRIFDERAAGIVTDNSGLPESFVISSPDDRRLAAADAASLSNIAPIKLTKVLLSNSTKIVSSFGAPLTVQDILLGAKVEVQGQAVDENTIQASLVKIALVELKGKVSPEDVDAEGMVFKLTLDNSDARVAIKVKEETLILLESEQARPRRLMVREFFRLILANSARLEVEGLIAPDETRTIIALRIRIKGI
jgi:hypothetical protein